MKNQIKPRKGATCLHFRPANLSSSDRHNERILAHQMNENIDDELTPQNIYWKDENIPDLRNYEQKCIEDYNKNQVPHKRKNYNPKTHTHSIVERTEHWKKNMSAIKEGVLILKGRSQAVFDTAMAVARVLENKYGLKVLRVYLHADEHRNDEKEGDVYNYHVHIVVSWYDWKHHKPFSYDGFVMSKFQDIAAEQTGLPRGNPTGKYIRGLSNQEFKVAMAIIKENDKRKEVLMKEYSKYVKRLRNSLQQLEDEPNNWYNERTAVQDVDNQTEEVYSFIPMPQHPIAYANCIDRFEKKVSEIRNMAENVEDYIEYQNDLEMQLQNHELDEGQSRVNKLKFELQTLEEKKKDFLQSIPSPLQTLRFVQELRDRALGDVEAILRKYNLNGHLDGMELINQNDGKAYEFLEIERSDGTRYLLNVSLDSGTIYKKDKNGNFTKLGVIPELFSYLRASITPEMRGLLEEAYPITKELKEKRAIKQQKVAFKMSR